MPKSYRRHAKQSRIAKRTARDRRRTRNRFDGLVQIVDSVQCQMRDREITTLTAALRDVLVLYDRAVGNVRLDCGYTAGDVKRLAEIRKLLPWM